MCFGRSVYSDSSPSDGLESRIQRFESFSRICVNGDHCRMHTKLFKLFVYVPLCTLTVSQQLSLYCVIKNIMLILQLNEPTEDSMKEQLMFL